MKEKESEHLESSINCPEYIWCLIPVYNHSKTLRSVVENSLRICKNIVVVDDGSEDAKVAEILNGLDIKLLTHSKNKGKGTALRTGADYIIEQGGKYIITIDADGQHNPDDIKQFLPYMKEEADTIVIGNRHFASEHVPERSKFGRKFSNFWIKLETGCDVLDSQSGFRAYPAKLFTETITISDHYDYETEILVRGVWSGLQIKNVDISVYYPEREKRITHFKPFKDNLRISLLHSRLTAEKVLFHTFFRKKNNDKRTDSLFTKQIEWYLFPAAVPLLAVLFTVIGLFSRSGWYFEVFANFRVQYAVVSFLAAVWLAIYGRKHIKLAIFAFITAAAILFSLADLYQSPPPHLTPSKTTIKLMQINVNTANTHYDKVRNAILKNKPDVVVLEEVSDIWIQELQKLKTAGYIFVSANPHSDNFGIAVLSRKEPEKMNIRLPHTAAIPYTYAIFAIPDSRKKIVIFGIHTIPPIGKKNFKLRNDMLAEIAKEAKAEQKKGNIVIVAGDFNLTPWSYYFAKFAKDSGLRNSQEGFGVQPTWPAEVPLLWIPIDHCFVSPSIKVTERIIGNNTGSDHYPLISKMEIH